MTFVGATLYRPPSGHRPTGVMSGSCPFLGASPRIHLHACLDAWPVLLLRVPMPNRASCYATASNPPRRACPWGCRPTAMTSRCLTARSMNRWRWSRKLPLSWEHDPGVYPNRPTLIFLVILVYSQRYFFRSPEYKDTQVFEI